MCVLIASLFSLLCFLVNGANVNDRNEAVLSKYGVIYSHNHILRWLLNLRSTDHFRRPMEPTHLIGIQHLVDEVVQERRAAATTNIQRVVRGYQERERLKEADQRSKA